MKKFFVVMMCLIMTVCFMPTMAFATDVELYVAQIGTTRYESLAGAIADSKSGDTITLLTDLNDAGEISLPAGVTFDGANKVISGDSRIEINAAGGTVKNVQFKNIHNTLSPSESDMKKYNWTSKIGTQTAVLAENLTGKATVIDCSFDVVDWDAIRVTPNDITAEIIIRKNVFRNTSADIEQLRYVHIESMNKALAVKELTITDNQFYKPFNSYPTTSIGVFYIKKDKNGINTINLSGNYLENNFSADFSGNSNIEPVNELFPMRSQAGVDVDDYVKPAAYNGCRFYKTLQEAVEKEDSLIYLAKDCSESFEVPEGRSAYIWPETYSFSSTITNNGTLDFYATDPLKHTVTINNNGTLKLRCKGATGFTVTNNGTLNISGGSTSTIPYDLSKINNNDGGTVAISGGYFTTEPAADWLATDYYKVVPQDNGTYKVQAVTNDEAKALGYKVKGGSVFYKSLAEGFAQNSILTLIDNVTENVTYAVPDKNERKIKCENYTFNGSVDCGTKVLTIENGTAILDNITCGQFFVGNTNGKATNVTVKNGHATDVSATKNADLTIKDGEYSGWIARSSGSTSHITIEGGMFNVSEWKNLDANALTITGGVFTSDPTAYLADGYVVLPSDKSGFIYMVTTKPEPQTDAKPATGSTAVDENSLSDAMNNEEKAAVKEIAASVQANGGELAAAANAAVEEVTATQVDQAKKAYDASGISGEGAVNIYAQTYLSITPKEYKALEGDEPAILELDIQPMYRIVASKEDSAENLKVAGEAGVGETANAVVLEGSEKKLTNIKTMEVKITLPDGFPTADLKVKHTASSGIYYYIPKITVEDGHNVATFTVTNGFSPFEFLVDSRATTVQFSETDTRNYTAVNVSDALPTSTAPSGKVFGGWTFEGISGTYTTLTDDLLSALNGRTVTATPYFYTPNYGGGGSTVTTSLDTAKSEASKAVSEYVKPSDYEAAEQAEIKAITEKAMADIKNAKTEAEVKTIEAAAKAEIDKLETAEEMVLIRTIEATKFKARSKATTLNGKKAIRVTWNVPEGIDFDGFEIYRSTEKYKGFGTKPIFTSKTQKYTNNKGLKVGKTYYYKVRAFKYVNDEKVYTEYSYKAIRTVK